MAILGSAVFQESPLAAVQMLWVSHPPAVSRPHLGRISAASRLSLGAGQLNHGLARIARSGDGASKPRAYETSTSQPLRLSRHAAGSPHSFDEKLARIASRYLPSRHVADALQHDRQLAVPARRVRVDLILRAKILRHRPRAISAASQRDLARDLGEISAICTRRASARRTSASIPARPRCI